jgi:hypothetical protein|tara:strand:- start:218 stop:463 length:246 start_codon:yes stop_codon:yes gene_type:complete
MTEKKKELTGFMQEMYDRGLELERKELIMDISNQLETAMLEVVGYSTEHLQYEVKTISEFEQVQCDIIEAVLENLTKWYGK